MKHGSKPIVTQVAADIEENRWPACETLSERPIDRAPAGRYLVALLAPAIIAVIMQLTWPFFKGSPVTLFLTAVVFSAWYGGLGSGLVAMFVSLLVADYFFIDPYLALGPPKMTDLGRLVNLVAVGSVISVLSELMHRARRRAESSFRIARRAEVTRRAIEERYHTLFDQAPDGIVIADPASYYLEANASMCRMLGYTRDELIGLHASDIVTQSEFKHIDDALTVIKSESDYHREWQFRRKDGSVFDGEVIATAMPDGNLLGLVRDITTRKLAEEALEASVKEVIDFKTALDEHAIVAVTNRHGKITFVNDKFCAISKYSREELIGKDHRLINSGHHSREFIRELWATITQGKVWHGEIRNRAKDGSFYWVATTIVPFLDEQGKPYQYVAIRADITARKVVEEALEASVKEVIDFKTALDEHAIVAVTNPHGKITFVNDKFCAISKYSREELIGKDHRLINSGHHSREFIRDLWTTIAHGKVWQGEIKNKAKDGSFYWVATTIVPFLDEQGKPRQYVAIRADITERKMAEEAVRQSETRYRSLFDTLIDGFCTIEMIFDADGKPVDYRFLEINPAFEKQTGLHNVQGRLMRDIAPDHEAHWFEIYGKIALTGEPVQFENEAKALGRHYTVCAYRVGGPESRRVAVLFNDITERKQTEQVLRESEERFRFLNDLSEATRALADPAQIMAVMARMLGVHLRASRCAYADVEQDGEQFTILHDYTDGCESTVGNYQLSLFGARAVATLNTGQTLIIRNVEAELLSGEGADMFRAIGIQAIITCPLVKDGRLRAMMAVHQTTSRDWKPAEIAIVQDVVERCWATIERRTAEEKIHQLNAELEQRVTERTSQLETANKELEAFSYSVSHDLRAPLRGVDGYVRMLKEDCADQLNAEGNRLLDVVSSEAKRMGQLIDDLLSFSRLGREQMDSQIVDMTALAGDVFENLNRTAPESAARFELKSLPPTQGDVSMLRQVFVNLIGNAGKFSRHQSTPVVEVGGASADGQTTYYVKDNGVGFDEKYSHKLFGVFQRLHSEAEFEGTGVGLALVRRVIHRHGGKVWAEGKPNKGATFYFTLPIRRGPANG